MALTAAFAARTASGGIAAIADARSSARSSTSAAGHDGRHDAHRLRLGRPDPPPGEDELHRPRPPGGPRQPLRAACARDGADPDLGLPELGVLGGDEHVAGHRQLRAPAEREPAHGRDRRRPQPADAVDGGERVVRMQLLAPRARKLPDVGTGRERPLAGAGDDDRATGVVVIEDREDPVQLLEEIEREGVERVGPVEGDEGHAVSGRVAGRELDEDQGPGVRVVGHRAASFSQSVSGSSGPAASARADENVGVGRAPGRDASGRGDAGREPVGGAPNASARWVATASVER